MPYYKVMLTFLTYNRQTKTEQLFNYGSHKFCGAAGAMGEQLPTLA